MLKQPRYQKYRDSRNLTNQAEFRVRGGWGDNFSVQSYDDGICKFELRPTTTDNTWRNLYFAVPDEYKGGQVSVSFMIKSDRSSRGAISGGTRSESNIQPIFATGVDSGFNANEQRRISFTVSNAEDYVGVTLWSNSANEEPLFWTSFEVWDVMLNIGSTALPYEPYGVKIPDGIGENADIVPFHSDHRPVEVSVGRKSRNLIPIRYVNRTVNGLTFTVKEDGTYHVKGTSTAQATSSLVGNAAWTPCDIPAGTYTISGQGGSGVFGFNIAFKDENGANIVDRTKFNPDTFTLPKNAKQIYLSFRCNADTTLDTDIFPMLNEGSTALPFEKPGTVTDPLYTPRLESKSGSTIEFEDSYNYECEVEVDGKSEQKQLSGKNILNIVPWLNERGAQFTVDGDTIVITGAGNSSIYNNPLVFSDTDIDVTISVKDFYPNGEGTNGRIDLINSNGTAVTQVGFGTYDTTPKSAKACKLRLNWTDFKGGYTFSELQLEKGKQATPYEPYCGGIPSPNPDYPQEIESIGGRNLVDKNASEKNWRILNTTGEGGLVSGVNATDFIKVVEGKIYTASGLSGTGNLTGHFGAFYDSSKNYVSSAGSFGGNTKNITFVVPYGVSYIRFNYASSNDVQLEEGSTATQYIPYGCLDVASHGRNLFDPSKFIDSGTYKNFIVPTNELYTFSLKLKEGKTIPANLYIGLSVDGTPTGSPIWAVANGILVKNREVIPSNYGGLTLKYLSVYPKDYGTENITNYFDIQLTEGTTPHPYEPYHAHTATIDLQGNKLRSLPDGTKDMLRVYRDGRVELVKRVWEEIISRLDNKYIKTSGIPCFYGKVLKSECAPLCSAGEVDGRIFCSGYMQGKTPWDARAIDFICNTTSQNYPTVFYVTDSRFDNINDFNAWLSNNPIVVNYRLLEPQTIQLPSIDPIPQYYPTTILDGNGNDITGYVTVVD